MLSETDETLCFKHGTIKFLLSLIKKKLKKGNYDVDELVRYLDQAIQEIVLAKKLGQRMENRLRRYRYAIENLGFVRIKEIKENKDV